MPGCCRKPAKAGHVYFVPHATSIILLLKHTHLYPTLFPVPSRASLFPPFFRRETKDERTTAAAETSSSFRAGPHHGLRRKAANTALELFPGITTYFGRWKEQAPRSKHKKLVRTLDVRETSRCRAFCCCILCMKAAAGQATSLHTHQ